MPTAVITIARYTVLEALRTKLLVLTLVLAATGVLIARFLERIAISDSDAIRTGIMASQYRLAAVVLMAAFVIVSHVRESNDKGLELLLSFPIRRSTYLLGRLLGHLGCAAWLAALFSLPMVPFAAGAPLAVWAASLWLELSLVAAASVFCVITLNQVTSALMAVIGFYLFARTLPALQLIAGSQMAGDSGPVTRLMGHFLDALAFVTPRLDLFTRASWLVDAAPSAADLASVAAQACIYTLLLCAAALFDLYRKNL